MNLRKVVETKGKILEQQGRFKIADNIKEIERKTNKNKTQKTERRKHNNKQRSQENFGPN